MTSLSRLGAAPAAPSVATLRAASAADAVHATGVTLEGAAGGARAVLAIGAGDASRPATAAQLHAVERAMLDRFQFEPRRDAFAIGRACAKAALRELLGRADVSDVCVRRGELGQPVVDGVSGVGVSISHRGGYGAAIAYEETCPLGVDLEIVPRAGDARAPELTANERDACAYLGDEVMARTVLFSAKEALSKVLRVGLAVSPDWLEVERVERDGAVAACTFKHLAPLRATCIRIDDVVLSVAHPRSVRVGLDVDALRSAIRAREAAAREPPRLPFVLMFSGQGSQYFQMAAKLHRTSPAFREWMERADAHLARAHGLRVLATIHDPTKSKGMPFLATPISNAAIVMVEVAVARALEAQGFFPEVLVGTSLGEIAAAIVADVVDFEVGLDLAVELGRLVDAHAARGKLVAVLAPIEETRHLALPPWEIAATFAGHFVAAVREEHVATFVRALERAELRYHEVPVEYPFHSGAIDGVRAPLERYLRDVPRRTPRVRFVSSARVGAVSDVTPEHVWSAIRDRIAFRETIDALAAERSWTYVDASPSGSLAGHLRQQLPGVTAVAALTPFGHDDRTFAATIEALAKLRTAPVSA
jgi:malonyl CoA-acyl carrier protein transacylase/4'-phosphopantetheinyl transferase EntD